MNNQNTLTLKIESEAFAPLRTDLNTILKRTLTNMEHKQSDTAEISVKLKIELAKMPIRDDAFDDNLRYTVRPKFVHKVSSVLQVKDEESGSMSGEYELVWDDEAGEYVMRPIHDPQISMDDSDDSIDDEYQECTVSDPAELSAPATFLLESGETETEYDDAITQLCELVQEDDYDSVHSGQDNGR